MRYVTESLADALYKARLARLNENTEEVKEGEDFDDVDDIELEPDNEKEVDKALGLGDEDTSDDVDEARWVTMKNGNHALIDDDGGVLAGGDPKTRKDASKKEIEAAAKDAGSK